MIEERLSKDNEHINENIIESLFNFWEFVNNEYYTIPLESLDRLKLTQKAISIMCKEYTKKWNYLLSRKRYYIRNDTNNKELYD